MYKLLIVLTFNEPGNDTMVMTSTVAEFNSRHEARTAREQIEGSYPHGAVYVRVTELWRE